MKDRSDDPLYHERTLLPRSYISLHIHTNTYIHTYIHQYIQRYIHTYIISTKPVHHLNMCVLSQNPTYIQCIFKYIKNIHTYIHTKIHTYIISPEPVRHLNMCVLSQNPTYIQYIFKYKIRTYLLINCLFIQTIFLVPSNGPRLV